MLIRVAERLISLLFVKMLLSAFATPAPQKLYHHEHKEYDFMYEPARLPASDLDRVFGFGLQQAAERRTLCE